MPKKFIQISKRHGFSYTVIYLPLFKIYYITTKYYYHAFYVAIILLTSEMNFEDVMKEENTQ